MKIVASHQPHFNPVLSYFAKIKLADVFVLSDDVQYRKNWYINRNKIRAKNEQGWRWLTVPVKLERHDQRIKDIQLGSQKGGNWRQQHLNVLAHEYQKSPWCQWMTTVLFNLLYDPSMLYLWEFNMEFLRLATGWLGIDPNVRFASGLELDPTLDKNGRIIQMVQRVGGDAYLAGAGAIANYLDPQRFEEAGIALLVQENKHPTYSQVQGGEFLPYMGVMDVVMNLGYVNSQKVLDDEHFSYRRTS